VTGGGSSLPEGRRLLAVLAAGKRCAEVGTACGEGAAALASTARSLVTVELDPDRLSIAAYRLRRFPNVELLAGDWRDHLPQRTSVLMGKAPTRCVSFCSTTRSSSQSSF